MEDIEKALDCKDLLGRPPSCLEEEAIKGGHLIPTFKRGQRVVSYPHRIEGVIDALVLFQVQPGAYKWCYRVEGVQFYLPPEDLKAVD